MSDRSRPSPTARFSGLADVYASYRPSYPEKAMHYILTRCGLLPSAVVADVGCGTGISSRLLALHGLQVVGIEPNADMRARAEAEPWTYAGPAPHYVEGTAEATGLPDASADAVQAAQAFHWFEADAALREFRRVLKPAGWAVLLWNERDEADPCTAAYGAVVRAAPEAAAVEGPRGRAGYALLTCPFFEDGRREVFHYAQPLTEEGLLGRAFSASYAPREPVAAAQADAALRAVFARFQQGGQVVLRYETAVFTARRAAR
jgi:SAM-dependent methyltransferase